MVDQQIDFVSHLAAALGVDMKEVKPMGHLDSFAEDVNEVVADLEKQFGDLNARKQKIRERGADIAGRWAQHFTSQEGGLTAAEAALNRISNVPLSTEKKDG
jgi:hypothetical protein